MELDIRTAYAAERPIAVISAATTWDEYPELWQRLLDRVHAEVQHPGRNVMYYKDDLPHVEVGVEILPGTRLGDAVQRSSLPAGEVATTTLHGPYDGLEAAHAAVHRWCAAHAHTLAGPRWEVYGHWHDDPARLRTEISYLIQR